jgi:hypothetical protein
MKTFILAAILLLLPGCAIRATWPGPSAPDKEKVTYWVSPGSGMTDRAIDDGLNMLRRFGYKFVPVRDPARAMLTFEAATDLARCARAHWVAARIRCGRIEICPVAAAQAADPRIIAHETAHALGVKHVRDRCDSGWPPREEERGYGLGRACGRGIMNRYLWSGTADFTEADARAFALREDADRSVFSRQCGFWK